MSNTIDAHSGEGELDSLLLQLDLPQFGQLSNENGHSEMEWLSHYLLWWKFWENIEAIIQICAWQGNSISSLDWSESPGELVEKSLLENGKNLNLAGMAALFRLLREKNKIIKQWIDGIHKILSDRSALDLLVWFETLQLDKANMNGLLLISDIVRGTVHWTESGAWSDVGDLMVEVRNKVPN